MIIATWNVNSVRVREERLLAVLARHQPDVLCLQELKCEEPAFPHASVAAAGYQVQLLGQKTYNGVAILSREPAHDVARGMTDGTEDPQARFIAATIGGVRVINVYVPNGSEVGSEKYAYKLAWLGRLRKYLDTHGDPQKPLALCGDMNVAPDDLDVRNPSQWADTVLCHTDVRKAFANVCEWGLVDPFREKHPDGKVYSWWDYRNLGFQKNDGLRIDHVVTTPALAKRCTDAKVDREERKGKGASDHAPVLLTFEP